MSSTMQHRPRDWMQITANKITLLRLILLPIPCVLLFGGPWHKAVALVFFILIGLTDYLDGYLARKQGPTTLGSLLDPMADKIFITAMFVPLAQMKVIPIWMVLLLFIREFTVTELRSIHGTGGLRFKTSELAKYKTTIQMIGGSAIICNEIFQSHWGIYFPMGGILLFTLILSLRTYIKQGHLGARSLTLIVLVAFGVGLRCALSHSAANLAIMALVVAITWLSGIQYVTHTWRQLGGYLRERFGPREWASFVGIALAFPAIYISILYSKAVAVWIIIPLLSSEFASGGLKNFISSSSKSPMYGREIVKTFFLNGAGMVGMLFLILSVPSRDLIVNAILLAVLAASLLYCMKSFYSYRHALFRAEPNLG